MPTPHPNESSDTEIAGDDDCNDGSSGVESVIDVTAGDYSYEVSWTLTCQGMCAAITGGATYTQTKKLSPGASCTLDMADSYGDGWNGAELTVSGWTVDSFSLDQAEGDSGSASFTVPLVAIASPPPAPPSPPPSPLSPCSVGEDDWVNSSIVVTAGNYPSEVSWTLSCGGMCDDIVGGAQFEEMVSAPPLSDCTLEMEDSYGDGWNGAELTASGWLAVSFSIEDGPSHIGTFQIPTGALASPPPTPPVSPPLPCSNGNVNWVNSSIIVTEGYYPSEVSWTLSCVGMCDDIEGGAPFEEMVSVPPLASCILEMEDSWGDGWNGAIFKAPGWTAEYFSVTDGSQHTETFVSPTESTMPTPEPSPEPCYGSEDETLETDIVVTAGSWPGEVSWTLSCEGMCNNIEGDAPFEGTFSAPLGANCTLEMMDSYGDGWNGAELTASGWTIDSFSLEGGFQATATFNTSAPASRRQLKAKPVAAQPRPAQVATHRELTAVAQAEGICYLPIEVTATAYSIAYGAAHGTVIAWYTHTRMSCTLLVPYRAYLLVVGLRRRHRQRAPAALGDRGGRRHHGRPTVERGRRCHRRVPCRHVPQLGARLQRDHRERGRRRLWHLRAVHRRVRDLLWQPDTLHLVLRLSRNATQCRCRGDQREFNAGRRGVRRVGCRRHVPRDVPHRPVGRPEWRVQELPRGLRRLRRHQRQRLQQLQRFDQVSPARPVRGKLPGRPLCRRQQ